MTHSGEIILKPLQNYVKLVKTHIDKYRYCTMEGEKAKAQLK